MKLPYDRFTLAAGMTILTLGGLTVVDFVRLNMLSTRVTILETELASSTLLLQEQISDTHNVLISALDDTRKTTNAQLGSVAAQVGSISGTVGTLEKLSKTDPELLAKYSKVYFLNENYAPDRVVSVDSSYLYNDKKSETIHAQVWPFLQDMLRAAQHDDVELYVYSAYRSFTTQGALKGTYTVTYGAGTANTFSADQGYSEHQLGTTVDLITTGLNGQLEGFEKTEAYTWLLDNAYKYGFILSYPKNNGYYVFEPWHWRFVGVKLATKLHREGKNFYDLDQRNIDEYLVDIFDE